MRNDFSYGIFDAPCKYLGRHESPLSARQVLAGRGQTRFSLLRLALVGCLSTAASGVQAAPQTTLNVNLNGWAWGSPFSTSFYFENSLSPSGLSLQVTRDRVRADAGQISTGWDDFGFSRYSFRGLNVAFPIGRSELSLVGGQSVATDLLGRQESTAIFGLRGSIPLSKQWSASASQLFAPGARLAQDKSISSLALNYTPSARLRASLSLARSDSGAGAQLAAQWTGRRFSLQGNLRRTSNNLSSIANPLLLTDRNGLSLSGSYRLTPTLSFSGAVARYSDAFDARSYDNYAALSWTPRRAPTVSLFFQKRQDQLTFGPNRRVPLAVTGSGIGVSHSIGSTFLSLNLERLSYPVTPNTVGLAGVPDRRAGETQISAGLRRPLGRDTLFTLQHTLSRSASNSLAGVGSQNQSFTSFNLAHRLGRSGVTLDLGLDEQGNRYGGSNNTSRSVRAGVFLPMGRNGTLGVSYRAPLSSSGLYANDGGQLYLTLSRRLEIGRRPSLAAGLSFEQRRQLGSITGRVFDDLNDNGLWDTNEPGVSDVEINANDVQSFTGEAGAFTLRDLFAGPRQVRMAVKSLPIEYALVAPSDVDVTVPEGKAATVAFPVRRTGQVAGVAFLDANRNGKQDEGELPLVDAVVRVVNNDAITFTLKDGSFIVYNVPPKEWEVAVDTDNLAQGVVEYEATNKAKVRVRPNQTTEGIVLGVAEKPRPVIFSDLDAPAPGSIAAAPNAVAPTVAAPSSPPPVAEAAPSEADLIAAGKRAALRGELELDVRELKWRGAGHMDQNGLVGLW